ncbi:histidine kinase [Brachybacterium sp. ACRRE]|uniref:histidine kinase n=1 Tax=Brachybacterium sp. ACRRE TaxID=2918184 RepID=UPI001EF3A0D1|nr:histidine kinase [Brachybacterium sp. ACRRE]
MASHAHDATDDVVTASPRGRRDDTARRAHAGPMSSSGSLLGSPRLTLSAAIALAFFLAVIIIPTTFPSGAASVLMGIGLSIGGGLSITRPVAGGVLIGLVLTVAILDPLSSPGLGVLVPPIALAACAGEGRLLPGIVIGLWHTTVITVAAERTMNTTADLVTNALVWIFMLTVAYLLGALWRSMILRLATERARHAFDLAEQRRAIARDLHDTGVRAITEVILLAETAQHADGVSAADAEAFARISRTARLSTDELRSLMDALRTDVPVDGSTDPTAYGVTVHAASWDDALQAARDRLQAADFTVNLSSESDAPVPPSATPVLSRCLWEVVANVIRHADDEYPVAIMSAAMSDGVELLVRNTIDHDPVVRVDGGDGLRGLGEQLEAVGGSLETQRDGDTFLTRIQLPTDTGR